MKVRLGYVALPISILDTSSHALTYTRYQKMEEKDAIEKLHQVILSNIDSLKKILIYNQKNDIYFYRMTSSLLPLVTHEKVLWKGFSCYEKQLKEVGQLILQNKMRVDIHPDPFYVLNSSKEEVVENTMRLLKFQSTLLDTMGFASKIILHVGSQVGGKSVALKRFKDNFYRLDLEIQKKIVLENDDKIYTASDTLQLCQELKIPMVLDVHHHFCNPSLEKLEDLLLPIFETWKDLPPKIHFSSPKNQKEKRSHHDYIQLEDFLSFLDLTKKIGKDFDVMIEAKAKDEALFRLIRQIKYKTTYFVQGTTIFLNLSK